MTRYIISLNQPEKHYIDIMARFDTLGASELRIQLPAWRPGRYELANFAQNIRKWKVTDESGNPLLNHKIKKDEWIIESNGCKSVTVQYDYYSNQLDAGNTYFNENQLYINPVNCFIYIKDRINESCELEISNLPASYHLVSSIVFDDYNKATIKDYHTLADAPFIASSAIQSAEYKIDGYNFKISVVGNAVPDWDKIIRDFSAFSAKQIELFGELPVMNYHFLFQMPDYRYYHGVEHLASTVICLGPAANLHHSDQYNEFLGISSHELFHSWNVKSIRPKEMFPYDYSQENYTVMNYVTEGVTTYYGDLMLLRSGGFNDEVFFAKTAKTIERHEHNFGKFYQTLTEASMDAWLDGYKAGAPDRKISFYQKGMMVAWLLDLTIRMDTENKNSLDNVMQILYNDFAKQNKGYSESDYLDIIESVSGINYLSFFKKYIWGLDDVELALNGMFNYIGCTILQLSNPLFFEDRYGFRLLETEIEKQYMITHIAPGSPAEIAKLSVHDKIIAVNGISGNGLNMDDLIRKTQNNEVTIDYLRSGKTMSAILYENNERFYPVFQIIKNENAADIQKHNYKLWSHREF